MNDGHELRNQLNQFTGSELLYRHSLARMFTYTQGVRFFAQNAGGGAYWLLDILATEPGVRNQVLGADEGCGFASVRLKVFQSHRASIVVDDGNGNVKFQRMIDLTDCPPHPKRDEDPDAAWLFFIEPNQLGDGAIVMTMMLPGER